MCVLKFHSAFSSINLNGTCQLKQHCCDMFLRFIGDLRWLVLETVSCECRALALVGKLWLLCSLAWYYLVCASGQSIRFTLKYLRAIKHQAIYSIGRKQWYSLCSFLYTYLNLIHIFNSDDPNICNLSI